MQVDYDPSLNENLVAALERAAGKTGLPIRKIELLGQDAPLAQAYVDSVAGGYEDEFVDLVDWEALDDAFRKRRQAVLDLVAQLTDDRPTRKVP